MRLVRIRWLLLSILFIAVAACTAHPSGGASGPTPTAMPPAPELAQSTYTVQRGTVARSLEFTARVAPVQQADLFFRADGHLSRLLVQRDVEVHEGDLLAELEMTALQRQLETAQLNWQQAQVAASLAITRTQLALTDAQLALSRAYAPDPQVLRAQLEVTRTQETLAYAQQLYHETWERPEPDAVRSAYYQRVVEAERDLALAQATYEDALAAHSADIRRLQVAVEQARLNLEETQAGPDSRLAQQVQQLEAQVAEHQLVAPFDGVVLAISGTPGDNISAYQTVLVVGNPSTRELRADLSAEQVGDLSVGMTTILAPADYPGQTIAGQVHQLPYGWGGDVEETDHSVHITFGSDAPDLALGALVRVIIVLEEKDDALWLPPVALQTYRGRTFVIVQESDGTQRRVDVVKGIESDERIEIVSGLEEGQVVVGP